jgi:hypothetical protein
VSERTRASAATYAELESLRADGEAFVAPSPACSTNGVGKSAPESGTGATVMHPRTRGGLEPN